MGRTKILIADDDPNIRRLLQQVLEEDEEYEIHLAKDGLEAKEKMEKKLLQCDPC